MLNVKILNRSILYSASTKTTESMSLYRALIHIIQGLLNTNRDSRGDIEPSLICLIILLLDSRLEFMRFLIEDLEALGLTLIWKEGFGLEHLPALIGFDDH